ncbi:hypothetical protein TWF694_006952 [Orbilia ellipsospora]|uniref:Uncharacterized protein n=1 Tax=Orbilia ellipsospora TaxID=2528407 RepID=A0AAV9XQ44_9PEZI
MKLSTLLLVPLLAAVSASALASGSSEFERRQARAPAPVGNKPATAPTGNNKTPPSGDAIKKMMLASPLTKGLKPAQLKVLQDLAPSVYAQIFNLKGPDFDKAMNDLGSGKAPTIPASAQTPGAVTPQGAKGPQANLVNKPRLNTRAITSEGESLKVMVLEQAKTQKVSPKILTFINGLQPQVFEKIAAGPPQNFGKAMSAILAGRMPAGIPK